MTEEDIRKISEPLKAAIEQERAYLAPVLNTLGEAHQEVRRDVDTLADRLAAVVLALVEADGVLAQRVDRVEQALQITPEPERRGLLSRLVAR